VSFTPRPDSSVPRDSDRARAIRIQRVAVITFAVVEAAVMAWALFR